VENKRDSFSLDAVIMAGGLSKWRGKRLIRKCLLQLRGKPLFIYVLEALRRAKRFRRIYIVGPKNEIEVEILKAGGFDDEDVVVLQEGENLVQNLLLAFNHSADMTGGRAGRDSSLAERPMFAVGADSPLILPGEIVEFLDKCDLNKADYFIGMTPEAVLNHFKTDGLKRGISLAYTHFAEGVLRINNMHLIKPLKILNPEEFNEIYKIRHLRKLGNFFRLAVALYKRNLGFRDWVGWLKMYLAMWFHKARLTGISDALRSDLTYARAEGVVSHLLGARTKMVLTSYGGAALDVDKPGNIRVISRRFDEWTALQQKLGGTRVETSNPGPEILGLDV